MKILITLMVFFYFGIAQGQEFAKLKNGEEFRSIFQNLDNGCFNGTVNGILLIEKDQEHSMILDFQGSHATLNIVKDSNEVYNISTESSFLDNTNSNDIESAFHDPDDFINYQLIEMFKGVYLNTVELKFNGSRFERKM